MRRAKLLSVALCACAVLAACRTPATPATPAAASNADVLQDTDFFVGEDALGDNATEMPLGSIRRSVEGGGFYAIGDSVDIFTKYAWKSRRATGGELQKRVHVACFLSATASLTSCGTDVKRGPRTRAEAFTGQWVVAPLTEVPSGGVVNVGGCRCDADGLRLVVR